MTLDEVVPRDPDLPLPESSPFCPFDEIAMEIEYKGWLCPICLGGYAREDMAWVPSPIARYWRGR